MKTLYHVKVRLSLDLLVGVYTRSLRDVLSVYSLKNDDAQCFESGISAKYNVYEENDVMIFDINSDVYETEAIPNGPYSLFIPAKVNEIHGHTHGLIDPVISTVDEKTFLEIFNIVSSSNMLVFNQPYLHMIVSSNVNLENIAKYSIETWLRINFYTVLPFYDYKLREIKVKALGEGVNENNVLFISIKSGDVLYIHAGYDEKYAKRLPKNSVTPTTLSLKGKVSNGLLTPLTQWYVGLFALRLNTNKIYVVDELFDKAWIVNLDKTPRPKIVKIPPTSIEFKSSGED